MEISESAKRISELQSGEIFDSDMFVVSKPLSSTQQVSEKVTLLDLFSTISSAINGTLSVGTMAYENKYDYAKRGHVHDYTNVEIRGKYSEGTHLGTFTVKSDDVDAYKVSVFLPEYPYPRAIDPYVGEFKMFVGQTPSSFDISVAMNNKTFDGWVYPQGQTMERKCCGYDFTEAYELFGGKDDVFTIPTIYEFFRITQNPELVLSPVERQTGLKSHQHVLKDKVVKNEYHISTDITMKLGQKNSTGNLISAANGSTNAKKYDISAIEYDGYISAILDTDKAYYFEYTGNGEQSYPAHNVIPCMLYIGKELEDEQ